MAFALPLKLGGQVPDFLYAALLVRRPDADGHGYLEIEGGLPRVPVTIIGRSAPHFTIPHSLVLEVPPQDVQCLGLFDSPDAGCGPMGRLARCARRRSLKAATNFQRSASC